MSSRSSRDSASVQLFFDWDADMGVVHAEVRDKIDQIRNELPGDVENIRIQNWGTEDIPILFGRIVSSRDLRNESDFLELKIKQPIERIHSVADVEIWGAQRQEIDVYLRLDDLKRHRADIGRLFRQLDGVNLSRSLGRVVDGDLRYTSITRGTLKSLEEIQDFPVDGRGLRLADIADVVYDLPTAFYGQHLNGEYAIGFAVRKTSQANTVETVNQVMARIEELRQDPGLRGVELLVWRNAGEEITKSLSGLLTAGVVGAVLAAIVLFVFLRKLGATLIVAFAIPFSVVASIGLLHFTGYTLNVLTMLGLMLATGMLVDNAVVVLESIYQKLEKGMDRFNAARVGTREVYTAVIAATLTSIIIFVPLIFGKRTNFSVFLGYTGAAIIYALLCSLFISLTLIPLAMGRFLKMDPGARPRWEGWLGRYWAPVSSRMGSITEYYLTLVAWPLNHRLLVGIAIVPLCVVGSAWLLMNKVPDNSPEAEELGSLEIQYEFSENYHYAKIEQDYVGPVERFLLGNRGRFKITEVFSRYSNDDAFTEVYFDKNRITLEEMERIRKELSERLPVIPGARIRLGRQSGARAENFINASLYGDRPETLQALAREARRRLLSRPDFDEVYTDLNRAQEEVAIRLDRALARKYGISAQSVSDLLAIVVRGRQVRGFRTARGEVDIIVRLQSADRDSLQDLKSVVVGRGRDGQEIQLSQVADLEIQKIPATLRREDRRTYSELWAVYSGEKRDEGMKQVTEVMNSLTYPPGYGWSYGFWTRRQQSEDRDFLFNILLALFMVYFVMASLFESFAHPFAIMFSLPFAVVGITAFLFITGTPFNIMAKIGLLVLIGIVVNNGIILIDHINNLRREGISRREAILAGCRERLRPILMTAGTTVVGLIPLAFSTSSLFDLRYFPMARTVMGGLIASTILTLIVLPTYYTLFDDLAVWLKRTWQTTGEDSPPVLLKS